MENMLDNNETWPQRQQRLRAEHERDLAARRAVAELSAGHQAETMRQWEKIERAEKANGRRAQKITERAERHAAIKVDQETRGDGRRLRGHSTPPDLKLDSRFSRAPIRVKNVVLVSATRPPSGMVPAKCGYCERKGLVEEGTEWFCEDDRARGLASTRVEMLDIGDLDDVMAELEDHQREQRQARMPVPPPIKVGDVVHAADRANYGTVIALRSKTATVWFVNNEKETEATVDLPLEILKLAR